VNLQVITDAGYLANPYREIRFLDGSTRGYGLRARCIRYAYQHAVQVQAKYYLPYRAAVTGLYRYYNDTWGVIGNTYELDYTHPIRNQWIFEGRVRYYKQSAASFTAIYSFPVRAEFHGSRPKSRRIGQHHDRRQDHLRLPARRLEDFQARTVTGDVSRIRFNYHDFRDNKDFGVAQGFARVPSLCINSTLRSISSICRCISDRSALARATRKAASERVRKKWRSYPSPSPRIRSRCTIGSPCTISIRAPSRIA